MTIESVSDIALAGVSAFSGPPLSGTTNYVTKFTSANTVGNSQIVDNGTNVGIGTATPVQKMHVVGGLPQLLLEGSDTNVAIETSAGAAYRDTKHNISFSHYAIAGNGVFNYIDFNVSSGQAPAVNIMRVRGDGNVGIGTNSPEARLEVADSLTVRTSSGTGDTTGGSISLFGGTAANTGYLAFHRADGVRNGYIGWDNSVISYNAENGANHSFGTGNVGIATATPVSKLQVDGTITSTAADGFRQVFGQYGFFHRQDGNNYYMLITNPNDQFGLWNTARPFRVELPTSQVSLNESVFVSGANGNVGIGTGPTSAKLDVVGIGSTNIDFQATGRAKIKSDYAGVWFADSADSYKSFVGYPGPGAPNQGFGVYTPGGGFSFNVTSNGYVGIFTAAPTSPLQVAGLPIHGSNAAAIGAGLTAGAFYHAGDGIVRVVF
jgi:hypothetical protein